MTILKSNKLIDLYEVNVFCISYRKKKSMLKSISFLGFLSAKHINCLFSN